MKRAAPTLAVLLLTIHVGVGALARAQAQTAVAFQEVKGEDAVSPAFYEFSTATGKYAISNSGRGERIDGASKRRFNLRIGYYDLLMRSIYYADYEGDLLLVCETSNGESGTGFVARLDGRTLRTKWKRQIPGFNVGRALMEGRYAYLTAIGFVGKVDLTSGAYVWRHDKLYRRDGAFNSFELPEIQGDQVLFRESVDVGQRQPEVIRVRKSSGKIARDGA